MVCRQSVCETQCCICWPKYTAIKVILRHLAKIMYVGMVMVSLGAHYHTCTK